MPYEVIQGLLIPFAGTSLGAASVFLLKGELNHLVQRGLTGFAAGVMVAASVWSLLIPAMDQSESMGQLAFLPAVIGFWFGILFLLLLDHLVPHLHLNSEEQEGPVCNLSKRFMLVLAVVLHNIPEGIAISIPLYYSGVGKKKTCLYTLLSGLSEPVGALLAYVLLKNFINDIFLAFVLIFVAGLMISLSLNDILREVKNYRDNKHMIIGFFLATVLFIISMKII